MSSSESEREEIYSDEDSFTLSDDQADSGSQDRSTNRQEASQHCTDSVWSYAKDDCGPPDAPPKFKPHRVPGVQLPDFHTRADVDKYLTPYSFFKLFFTLDIIQHLCMWTNDYAAMHGPGKPSLYCGWTDLTPEDMYCFIALLMYMAVVKAPNVESFWSTAPLLHGLWARHFMSKQKFKAIQSFLKACNAETENNHADKLSKVRLLHDYINRKCQKLYQPYQHVSVDERMVRNKGRFTFRQFIKDKPTRWGMKLWVLADSSNGYTYDFEVYTGKGLPVSKNGLAYDVVMRLCRGIENQGYRLYFDNFYSSVHLLKDLLTKQIASCGTLMTNRKGVPAAFKDIKVFAKGPRGGMRWKREGNLLFLQWLDNKTVSFVSTIHKKANAYRYVKRRTKVKGEYRPLHVRQPKLVDHYNAYMSGVDKSDQLIGKYQTLRKTHRWWKTLFFHFLDVARVNSYILFNDFRNKNPDVEQLKRPASYNQLDFTLELIREMGKVTGDQEVPLYCKKKTTGPPAPPPPPPRDHLLVPDHAEKARNCVLCYRLHKVEKKTFVMCRTCGKHYCFISKRNCLLAAHQ